MNTSNHRVKRVLLYPLAAAVIMSAALIPSAPLAVSAAQADTALSAPAPAYSRGSSVSGNRTAGNQQQQALSRVAVIIDDFGNSMRGTEEMFKLPVKITVAVMPFLRSSEQDARRAHEPGLRCAGPSADGAAPGQAGMAGTGAVLTSMNDAEVRQRVEAALDNVPYAIGINNHMGSKVTGDERVMGIVLEVCKERGLFFVDSHTNYRSVAGRMARELGMPPVENHIFLDDVHSASHVAKQMKLVQERALSQKFCVTIGHVGIQGKETAAGIRSGIAEMKDKVQFVGISDLVREEWKWNSRLTLP